MTDGWLSDVFSYPAQVISVHDGDTITLLRDAGCNGRDELKVRVEGIDTTEVSKGHDLSREWASEARAFTEEWCDDASPMHKWPIRIWTNDVDKNRGDPRRSFTRYVAHLHRFDGADLGQWLIAKGLALGVRDWAPSKWPDGIRPGAWARESGRQTKVHLLRQVTPEVSTACGQDISVPDRQTTLRVSERCDRCWDWSAYSSPLWSRIVRDDIVLTYGSGSIPASKHPGAKYVR